MKPAAFTYHRPDTLDEALEILDDLGEDVKILAGGQSLVPLMNFRLATPPHLMDINGVAELAGSEVDGAVLRLGALTRHRELDSNERIAGACPLLARVVPYIGHPQIRSMGTLGGSLAHADPAAELPGAMLALDATIVATSMRGERRIPARDFFVSHFTTALQPSEIITSVEVPVAGRDDGSGFHEVAARHGDFAIAGAAVALTAAGDGTVADARVACIAVASAPARVPAAEKILRGQTPTAEVLAEAATSVANAVSPTSELKASASYKGRIAGVLARRAVVQAWAAATRRTV